MPLPSIGNRPTIPTLNLTPPSGGAAGPLPTSTSNLSPTGLTPRGGGGGAAPRLGSLVTKAMLPGSGASGIASALNPLSNSPTLTAAGNLGSTAAGDPAADMGALDAKAQAHQMTGIGNDLGAFGQSQGMELSHDANKQALGAMGQAAGQTQMAIAQNNAVSEIMNAKNQAAMVAGAVKGLGNVAKEAAQAFAQ